MHTIDAEIINGITWLVFTPGELRLRIGRAGRVELLPNTPTAQVALREIAAGTIKARYRASVELRVALDDGAAAAIEVPNAGDASEAARRIIHR